MKKNTRKLLFLGLALVALITVVLPTIGVIRQGNEFGSSGSDGKDGENGITPQLRINYGTNEWEVSYTNGQLWQSLGVSATGPAGKDGSDGKDGTNGTNGLNGVNGQDGKDGKDGDPGPIGPTGPAGKDGVDGKDGISPRIRINPTTQEWETSHNEGVTWVSTGVKASGEISSLLIDSTLSETSENPVQNKAITEALNELSASVDALSDHLLPVVSEEDDGKILTVVDGVWQAADIPSQEKTIEITENGTFSLRPDPGMLLSNVLVNVNVPILETGGNAGIGGTQITEFLPTTTFTNEYFSDLGAFAAVIPVSQETMEAWRANGEAVTVVYDGAEYELTPQVVTGADGSDGVCVGNLSAFGGTGNGEPFAVVPWFADGTPCFLIGSTVDTAPTEHTIRIYQEVSADGGGEWVIASGSVGATGDFLTVSHNLGVIPDVIWVHASIAGPIEGEHESSNHLMAGCYLSDKLLGEAGAESKKYGYSFLCNPVSNGFLLGTSSSGLENYTATYFSGVCNVTATTMQIGTNYVKLLPGYNYTWTAYARKSSSASGNQ